MSSIKKPAVFQFTSIKVSKKKGLAVEWAHSQGGDVEKTNEKLKSESDLIPHPDMVKAINDLKSLTMQYFETEEGTEDTLRIDQVTVTYHDTSDKRSVSVKATRTHEFAGVGSTSILKTPKIVLNDQVEDIAALIDNVNAEACAYVFDRKTAAPEMAFDIIPEETEAA